MAAYVDLDAAPASAAPPSTNPSAPSPARHRPRRYHSPSPTLSPSPPRHTPEPYREPARRRHREPSHDRHREPSRDRHREPSRDRDSRRRRRDSYPRRDRPRARSPSSSARSYTPPPAASSRDLAGRKRRRRGRRGRPDERRRRDRGRNRIVSPSRRLSDDVVADLFLESLKQVLRDRRPPFNISVVSDYMARNNRDWAVWKTNYATFSDLCRAMEAADHLVVARKGESVVVGSSKYDFDDAADRPRKRTRREDDREGERGPRARYRWQPDRERDDERGDRYQRDRYDRARRDRYSRHRDERDIPRAERDRYDRESYDRGDRRERGYEGRDRGERDRVERDRSDVHHRLRVPDNGGAYGGRRPGPAEDKVGPAGKAVETAGPTVPTVEDARRNEHEAETTLRASTGSAAGSSHKEMGEQGMHAPARQGDTGKHLVEDMNSGPSGDVLEPHRSVEMERRVEDNRAKQDPPGGRPLSTIGMDNSRDVGGDNPRRDFSNPSRSAEADVMTVVEGKAQVDHSAPSDGVVGSTTKDDRNSARDYDLERHPDPSGMETAGNTQRPDELGPPQDSFTGKKIVADAQENAELGLDGPQF